MPMVMGTYQAEQFGNVKLFAELVRRKDGTWFLMATVEFDDEPPMPPDDFLGVNQLSKRLVEKAKGTRRGIALEGLKGLRTRTRFRTPQRSRMGSWGFDQLRQFITYKAQQARVMLKLVDPAYTSSDVFAV